MMLRMTCSKWGANTTAIDVMDDTAEVDIRLTRSLPDTAMVTVVTDDFDLRISLADLRAYLNQREPAIEPTFSYQSKNQLTHDFHRMVCKYCGVVASDAEMLGNIYCRRRPS